MGNNNPKAAPPPRIQAFSLVYVDGDGIQNAKKDIKRMDDVREVFLVTGEPSFLVWIETESLENLRDVIHSTRGIRSNHAVYETRTYISLGKCDQVLGNLEYDPDKHHTQAFVFVSLIPDAGDVDRAIHRIERIAEEWNTDPKSPRIPAFFNVSGNFDMLIHLYVSDVHELNRILGDISERLSGVKRTVTLLSTEQVQL